MGDGEHSFEPTPRRMRVRLGGADIGETRHALLMIGGYEPPLYELSKDYFPRAHVRMESARRERPPLAMRHAGQGGNKERQCEGSTTRRSARS
jgi:hypothetical protein